MGNTNSRSALRSKVKRVIPPVKDMGTDENKKYVDRGVRASKSDRDRDQFLDTLVTLISSNTGLTVADHDFKLLYSRREAPLTHPFSSARVVAALVAINQMGVIKVKIEAERDGRDVGEAFRAFKAHVEMRLSTLLQSIPSVDDAAERRREGDPAAAVTAMEAEETVERAMAPVPTGGTKGEEELNGEWRSGAPPAYGEVKKKKK